METQVPTFFQQITLGIILRSSTGLNGRYVYLPLPRSLPHTISTAASTNLDIYLANSLAIAPHFPEISIHDVVSSNILYESYNTFPNFFHVYNLINHSHLRFSFPYHLTHVAAAIVIHDCSHFKVLFVCINEHPNPLFDEEGDHSPKPLVFYVYASESKNWSLVLIDQPLTSDKLLSNRRKPVHAGESIVYLDLTDRFLVSFAYEEERIHLIPKIESKWERYTFMLDEATRYCECKRQLYCAKFNPVKERVDVYKWLVQPIGLWRKVVKGKKGTRRGRVLGIHPDDETFVLMRSTFDEVSIIVIEQDFPFVLIPGRGIPCGTECFLHGMTNVLNATLLDVDRSLRQSFCHSFYPHENVDGPEGEFFAVSLSGSPLSLPP